MRTILLTVLASLSSICLAAKSTKVDHVVVLMLENRAFDHMLGWMKRGGPHGDTRIEGLTGQECNRINLEGPDSPSNLICVSDDALDQVKYDPDHEYSAQTSYIYACTDETQACQNATYKHDIPTMGGFVNHSHGVNSTTMQMWNSEAVPIITSLAKEFANFDYLFCDHPGPTFPNRQFVVSGTANGELNDEVPRGGYTQKTIYSLLDENKMSWNLFYEDSLAWAIFNADLRTNASKLHFRSMDNFYQQAAFGDLPSFSFIEPRIGSNRRAKNEKSFGLKNHQHPTASVLEGERLMKNVYEALRQGPMWNRTLFIITYDENGGFYDHVPPPHKGVPAPDNVTASNGFDYTRLGIRVPTIAISPWIPKGTLVHKPQPEQKPFSTSQWSLSSILATTQVLLGVEGGPLTKRDAWAARFDNILSLDSPRTDAPLTLEEIPLPQPAELERQQADTIDEHAHAVMRALCELVGYDIRDKEVKAINDLPAIQKEDFTVLMRKSRRSSTAAGGLPEEKNDFCSRLQICRPADCGVGIEREAEYADWRVAMWKEWMERV